MYRAMPEEPYPIPAVDLSKIDPVYYRQLVTYAAPEPAGTIIVDTPNRFLYLTMEGARLCGMASASAGKDSPGVPCTHVRV